MPTELERRYKRLYIDHSVLIGILNGIVETADFVLPDDARVVHVYTDLMRHGFAIIVESATYAPVSAGEEVPQVDTLVMRVRRKESTGSPDAADRTGATQAQPGGATNG